MDHLDFATVFGLAKRQFLTVGVFLILASWASALAGAVITYRWQHREAAGRSLRGFVRFCLPPEMLKHKALRLDLQFAVVTRLTEAVLIAPFLLGNTVIAAGTYALLSQQFGTRDPQPAALWVLALVVVVAVVIQDFVAFLAHYYEHKLAVLWELHKVHHSAEFLTPLSGRRHHPWQAPIESIASLSMTGLFLGSASYALDLPITESAVLGIDAYFLANLLSFYHLRHSHVPMRYGRLERWFMSPAQHQLHHSFEFRDWDKNFGVLLSVWDRWFGTIVYTDPNYRFRVGLEPQYQHQYDTVAKLFLTPVLNIGRMAWRAVRPATSADGSGIEQASEPTGLPAGRSKPARGNALLGRLASLTGDGKDASRSLPASGGPAV